MTQTNTRTSPGTADASAASATISACSPLLAAELSSLQAEQLSALFKALANPVRLRLLSRVASNPAGEACVCGASDVGVAQPTVSHHLKILREAGLLQCERRGTWVYYRVAPDVFAAMSALLAAPGSAVDEPGDICR